MSLYRLADLTLESELPLYEAPPVGTGVAECVLRFAAGSATEASGWQHHWRDASGATTLSWTRHEGEIRLGFPGLAEFAIRDDGTTIEIHADPETPEVTLRHLVLDQVLPRVMSLRGRLVFHAGAVATPFGACLFLGETGSGKSTLCASLARAGHPLLSDDSVVLRRDGAGGFEALPTYPGLRLWPSSRARLIGSRSGETVAHYSWKERFVPTDLRSVEATGVRRCYLLAETSGADVIVESLSPREAFLALVRQSFVGELHDASRAEALFEHIGRVVESLSVRRLRYPREFSRLPEIHRTVLSDLAAPDQRPGRKPQRPAAAVCPSRTTSWIGRPGRVSETS